MCYLLKKYIWRLLRRVKNLRSTACRHYRKCDVIYRYLHIELIWCLLMVQYLQNNVIMKWITRFIRFTGWIPLKYGSTTTPPIIRSEIHLLFEPLPSFWIKLIKQGSLSRFDKAPQIGNVTLIQGTIFRFRSSLPIEGDLSKRDQNCISTSGLICRVDSVHCVCRDRIHFQKTFHLIISNNSIILPVGKITRETHWWITAQKLP